jgi:hypothetical protein
MSGIPLLWEARFSKYHNCTLNEILIGNGRKFLINYQIVDDILSIPGRLTYGVFFPIDKNSVSKNEFLELVDTFISDFRSGLKIKWKLPPQYFSSEIFLVQNEFSLPGNIKEVVDLNQHIKVSDWEIRSMSKGNQKKLRQCVSVKMDLKTATADDISKCYDVLSRNRQAIGAQVTMKLSEIRDAMKNFPSVYEIKYLELRSEIAAMCLMVNIAPEVRYVLYWADNLSFRNYSPITLLCEKLVEQSLIDGVQILDLGISSSEGLLNEGLHRFKQNLGAIPSPKRTIFSNYLPM